MMMFRFGIISLIIVLFLFASGCSDEPGLKEEDMTQFNKISWIKGIWQGSQGNAKIYESWRSVNYRTLEGLSYTSVKGKRVFVQNMRLEQSNNRILLTINSDNDAEKTVLELINADENEVVFKNIEGEFPDMIVYQKEGKKMIVEISGEQNTGSNKQEFVYRKTNET